MAYAPFLTDTTSSAQAAKKKAAAAGTAGTGKAAKAKGITTLPAGTSLSDALGLSNFNGVVPGFSTDRGGDIIQPGYTLDQNGNVTAAAGNTYDPNNDFEVRLAASKAGKTRSDLYANAITSLEQALLGYGSESLARQTLDPYRSGYEANVGHPLDLSGFYSSFAGAADPNTGFSTLAQRARANLAGNRDLSNTEAIDNTLYGSFGAGQRNDLAYQQQLTGVNDLHAIQQSLGSIGGQLTSGLTSAQDEQDNAYLNAQNRAFNYALANPTAFTNAPSGPGTVAPTLDVTKLPGYRPPSTKPSLPSTSTAGFYPVPTRGRAVPA